MISRESWVEVVAEVLRCYLQAREPFTTASLYALIPPGENEALLAKIDLDRALAHGCENARQIVRYLQVVEEGWFFEQKAEYLEALRLLIAEGRAAGNRELSTELDEH